MLLFVVAASQHCHYVRKVVGNVFQFLIGLILLRYIQYLLLCLRYIVFALVLYGYALVQPFP